MTEMTTSQHLRPKIYVVSLQRSIERRARIAQQLSRLGVDFTFVDAVDAEQVEPEWLQAQVDGEALLRNMKRNQLSGPEIACVLSHRLVYEDIINSGTYGGLVLEDDVIVPPVFVDALEYFQKCGAALSETCAIYHLGALSRPYSPYLILRHRSAVRASKRLSFAECLILRRTEMVGAYGYFATRKAVSSLLASPRVEAVSDHWPAWARRSDGKLFVSIPAAVIHLDDPENSTIRASRLAIDETEVGIRARCHRLVRFAYRGAFRFIVRPIAESILK